MRALPTALRLVITGLVRLAIRVYYRSVQVQGLERIPAHGPVLLVANHPNSLLDPALIMTRVPRRVHFGAKHTLFQGAFGMLFEAFGAIPIVRAQDDRQAMGRNVGTFKRFQALLTQGRVAAIFPEGLSQDQPHVAPAKSGAARIALDTEAAADFRLGLVIVPIGLQFEPRRRFRGDAFIRVGTPLTVADLAADYAENPRQAARTLTDRIAIAIKRIAYHVEDPARIPFVERLADTYSRRARQTGIAGVRGRGLRGELKQRTAACLNHYAVTDPDAIAEIERQLKRYERLREAAGVHRRILEQPVALLPGPFGLAQAAFEMAVGAAPAVFGLLTSGPPFFTTKMLADRVSRREDHLATLSLNHVLAGALAFPLFYACELWLVSREYSYDATVLFARLLIPAGLFAWLWTRRMRRLAVHVGGRAATWLRLDAVARVSEAHQQLIAAMDRLRNRYEREVFGMDPDARETASRRTIIATVAIVGIAAIGVSILLGRDRAVPGLPGTPSPWQTIRAEDPAVVSERLEQDARGAAAAIGELDRLEHEMRALASAFNSGARGDYAQQDRDDVHRLQIAYLNLRTALLRTIWTYRGAHDAPAPGPFEARAFVLAYASAAALMQKAEAIVATFADNPRAQFILNEGDSAWDIPAETYNRLRGSLANAGTVAELHAAARRFDAMAAANDELSGEPWRALVDAAVRARPAIDRTAGGIGAQKLQLALNDLRAYAGDSRYVAQRLVSTWVGDFRFKTRPDHRGLITADQVADLRSVLQPGDVLLERRNWFMSNAFLPGFWPHAALYLGDAASLEALGVTSDARVRRHWSAYLGRDAAGHPHVIIEAVSEGVIFSSLEHSVGEADAVAVLRPRLTTAERREAVARAFSHYGKPYDFEFDFISTGRLVCTEVVYRSYDGMIQLPLTAILGRLALPADDFVRVYAREPRPFDLVRFLDADEAGGRAVIGTEAMFLETPRRRGLSLQ